MWIGLLLLASSKLDLVLISPKTGVNHYFLLARARLGIILNHNLTDITNVNRTRTLSIYVNDDSGPALPYFNFCGWLNNIPPD